MPFIRILSICGIIVLFIMWCLSYTYRQFLLVFISVFYPNLRPINNPKCVVLTDDNFVTNPGNCSIVCVVTVDGNLTSENVKSLIDKNAIQAKIGAMKTLRCPELKQYPVSVLGYPFLKQDAKFKLDNHVDELISCNILSDWELHQTMLNMSYPNERSPWQVLVNKNEDSRLTKVGFRIHHSLCDGRSLLKLFVEVLGKNQLTTNKAKFCSLNWKQELRYYLTLPFGLVGMTSYMMRLQNQFPTCKLRKHSTPHKFPPLYAAISEEFKLDQIKTTSLACCVQPSAIIMCLVTTAFQRYMQHQSLQTPTSIPIYLALPLGNHPPRFTNHLTIAIPEIPWLGNKDMIDRLQICDKIYSKLRSGDFHSRYFDCMTNLIATLPRPFRNQMGRMRGVVTGVSNLAGEQIGFSLDGHECLDFTISAGLPQGSIGLSFTILSYKNSLKVGMRCVANGNIFTEQDTMVMKNMVDWELANLKNIGKP